MTLNKCPRLESLSCLSCTDTHTCSCICPCSSALFGLPAASPCCLSLWGLGCWRVCQRPSLHYSVLHRQQLSLFQLWQLYWWLPSFYCHTSPSRNAVLHVKCTDLPKTPHTQQVWTHVFCLCTHLQEQLHHLPSTHFRNSGVTQEPPATSPSPHHGCWLYSSPFSPRAQPPSKPAQTPALGYGSVLSHFSAPNVILTQTTLYTLPENHSKSEQERETDKRSHRSISTAPNTWKNDLLAPSFINKHVLKAKHPRITIP